MDDGYGGNLPPDLLAFGSRFPQSPSIQSSISNINDTQIYSKSPISSPIYQHGGSTIGYTNLIPSGFRTLQHPKTGRTIAVANRSNSPFTPAPLIYPATMVMKQGYVTIPRKPRTPSWSASSATDFMPSSPTTSTATTATMEVVEPVYDNLGLRTTAAGNSVLNLNKLNGSTSTAATTSTPISKALGNNHHNNNSAQKYSMKDRPLPATPNLSMIGGMELNASKIYEPIQEQLPFMTSDGQSNDREPLYLRSNGNGLNPKIINGGLGHPLGTERQVKIPPRPPPKPKKKNLGKNGGSGVVGHNGQGSTSQLFEDEGEDGTEV